MTRRTAKSAAKNAHRGSPRPTTRPKSALGAPMSAMTWEKIDAKMMMSITIDVVRIVAWIVTPTEAAAERGSQEQAHQRADRRRLRRRDDPGVQRAEHHHDQERDRRHLVDRPQLV